jgi:Flp pilus assembly pilin Flp
MNRVTSVRVRQSKFRGQTMTEYALILATVAAVLVSLYTNASTLLQALVNQVVPLL